MVNNFYTLRALAHEWHDDLVGCTVGDAFSQVRDEVTLAFAHPAHEWMLRASCTRPFLYLFRSAGYSKQRSNVATLFADAFGRAVTDVRIATRDRMLFLDLAGGWSLHVLLFGSKANVLLVDSDGLIVEAFRSGEALQGTEAPTPRPAPMPDTREAFEDRWRTNRKTTDRALASAFTLFDRTLGREVMHRAGVTAEEPHNCTTGDRDALFAAGQALRTALRSPTPHVYSDGRFVDTLALVPLHHLPQDLTVETFATVDAAVHTFVRRTLAQRHFRRLYEPVERALREAYQHHRTSAERMLEELSNESRAGRYETWAHLLMASPQDVPRGADEVTLPNLFEDGTPVTIPLDPAKSAIDNAEHYYDRARRTRRSREEAEKRLLSTEEQAQKAKALLDTLHNEVDWLDDIKAFRKTHEQALARYLGNGGDDIDRVPFRRFDLGGGYEVWVGRNARQNDELTFRHAQKYDRWMHARGVPGSHAVLRMPGRKATPDKRTLHRAAAIAAYYSKARGSSLVPVMMAERKHVRKPSGGAPGQVFVEHEDVLLVEPGLPEAS